MSKPILILASARATFSIIMQTISFAKSGNHFARNFMSRNCPACGKVANPLESLKAGDALYHRLCFKCKNSPLFTSRISPITGDGCTVPLNLKTYKNYSGQIWCSNCLMLFARGSGVKGRQATPSAAKDSSQNSRSESTSRGNEHTDLLREVATLKEELHLQKQELRLQKQKLKRRMRKREDEMMRMIMG